MARSQVRHNVKDAAGNVIRNALCYVYETTTTTPVTDLFAAASGGSALPSLTSDAQGDIIGWLDVARTVDIKVTDNSNTAYYPSVSSRLLSWTDFTETVSVLPAQAAVDASVAAEAVLRASADTSEATTRATADTTNATAITTEATARAAADTAHNINAGAHTNLPYVPQSTKRAYFAFGNQVDTTTSFSELNQRQAFWLPVMPTRMRFHMWTYEGRNNLTNPYVVTSPGVCIGRHSLDSVGARTGNFTAAPTQVVDAFTTPADGSEYVSAWFTPPAIVVPGVELLLSVGMVMPAARTVTDGVTTNLSAIITSATAAFTQGDVGRGVSGTGIPGGRTIASVQSATQATMSGNATADGTGISITITTAKVPRVATQMFYDNGSGRAAHFNNQNLTSPSTASVGLFEMWLEYEYVGANKVGYFGGDSLTDGYNNGAGGGGAIGAWPSLAGMRMAQPWQNAGITGSTTADWTTSTTSRWTRFTTTPDYVVFCLGSNDISAGTALATIQANLVTIMGNARTLWPGVPIFLATIPPRGLAAATEAVRLLYNAWLRKLPNGADGVFHFDKTTADDRARIVTDGATNTNTTVTSVTALFTQEDVGRAITGTNIPASTTISAVASATSVTISQAATGTGTGISITIGGGPSTIRPEWSAADGTHFTNYQPMADAVRGPLLNIA